MAAFWFGILWRVSGTHDDEENRPVLMEAVEFCASQSIRLYIKTVDRLSRDQFLFQKLLRCGCKFKFVELPNADNFVLTMYCALAEKEAEFISTRTAQGIQQSKKLERYPLICVWIIPLFGE